jgi:hypothetical protein
VKNIVTVKRMEMWLNDSINNNTMTNGVTGAVEQNHLWGGIWTLEVL